MAELFDCTSRQIELWAKDGIVIRTARGRYDTVRSTRQVVRHLREQAAGRAGLDPQSDTAEANRQRALEQTALYRTKRLKEEGHLIEIARVQDLWSRIMRGVRQFVLGLPTSIAHEVPTLTAHDLKTIKRICTDALTDASMAKGFELGATDEEMDQAANDDVSKSKPRPGNARAIGATAPGQPVAVG